MSEPQISLEPDYQDAEREKTIFSKLRAIDDQERASHAQKGILGRAVRDQMLWQYREDPETGLPCRSFTRWVRVCAPYGYSTVMGAVGDIDELKDVPEHDLTQIRSSNFPTMLQLSTATRAMPDVLEAAKHKPADAFVEHIRRNHPDQHVESKVAMKFSPESSAAKVINEALDAALERGARTRDEALEMVCVNALQDWRLEDEVAESIRGESHAE
jgi:hypothetical protein